MLLLREDDHDDSLTLSVTHRDGPKKKTFLTQTEIRNTFFETVEEFKRLEVQLEKNPKRRDAFNLGVDSPTNYFQ